MTTSQILGLGLLGAAGYKAYSAYQSAVPTGTPITADTALVALQAETTAARDTAVAGALALGGLYFWMRR